MKTLFLFLFIPFLAMAQEYNEVVIFDMAGVTGDTSRSVSFKVKNGGANLEVDFTSVNCDLLQMNFGYGLTDNKPFYLDTIPGLSMPVTLDKTVYTNTFDGVESNGISFSFLDYSANYIWINIIDNAACTSGEIILRYKR
jgi:hypothetical protein